MNCILPPHPNPLPQGGEGTYCKKKLILIKKPIRPLRERSLNKSPRPLRERSLNKSPRPLRERSLNKSPHPLRERSLNKSPRPFGERVRVRGGGNISQHQLIKRCLQRALQSGYFIQTLPRKLFSTIVAIACRIAINRT